MKIRHLLLGLMICVAGTGAIGLSGGYLDDQNTTRLPPFLVFGHVLYEGGASCNSPNVSITNLNTGAVWSADTVSDSNFYQTLLSAADVNVSDVLRWRVTDGAVVNTTNRTVGKSDLESGGIFGFDVILQSIAPIIRGFAPESQINDVENATRRFNVTIDQVVDVTWLVNSSPAQTTEGVTDASYTHTNVAIGVWNISARACNENGTAMQKWIWNVTTLLPPNITSFAPPSPVRDTENATRTFGITVDQTVDVTWLINGTEVYDGADVNESSYTNTSAGIGVWNVTAVASNQNGTDAQEWIWHVTSPAPAPSSVFVIYGNVSYGDGSACNLPFTVITNLNTSEELIADNRTGESFYQLVTSSAFANAGNVLMINARKNGTPVGNATHTVNQTDIGNGAIKADINKRYLSDFTVVNVSFDPSEPLLIGDLVTINAMITNSGESEGETSVEFYDNKSITIERSQNNYLERPINDTITLPDILMIRVHFESFDAPSGGNITIYNKSRMVEVLGEGGTDYWTNWCGGGTIRIESWNAEFTVDRYEAVLANESITLGEGYSINLSAVWNLSDQYIGWATNGTHNITVRVDPCDQVIESDETNNERTEVIDVDPSLDFAVTKISLDPDEPVLGDVVEVSANITNYGNRSGTTVVGMYYDNKDMELERTLSEAGSNSTDIISLPPGVLGARLHFKQVKICDGEVTIYDGDGPIVERITHSGKGACIIRSDEWTDWICGENITIRIELLPQQYTVDSLPLSTNLTWEDDLNNGTVPEELKDQLVFYGGDYLLSDNATVEKEDENEWIIIDEEKKRYCIKKEYDKLVVYYYDYTGYIYEGSFEIDEYEALIAEEPVILNATESKVINASWRTGAAYGGVGYHNITAVVDPRNHFVETNETNNTLIEQVLVNGTDLTVTAIEISCGFYPDRCYVGQDVNVTATIENIGAVDATDLTVVFLDGICSDYDAAKISDNNFTNVHIARLNSGESRNISVIWNPLETGWHMITASIPYDNTDDNKKNNELFEYTEVEPFCDFVVESVSVEPRDDVRRGESVNITATVGSSSKAHGGGNVSVAFFVNTTDYAGSCGERFIRIKTIDDVYVGVGETETVSTVWDVDVAGGCHLIAAAANPDEDVEELEGITPFGQGILFRGNETGNNVKNCTLHVIPNDLDITNIALVPAEPNIGDLVDVSATIRNNGCTEAKSTVWFYMEKEYSQSLTLQPENVMMRVHLDIKINNEKGGEVTASVNDSAGDSRPVHFYVKCGEYGGQDMEVHRVEGEETDCFYEIESDGYRHWDNVWTEWVNGTAIEINAEGDAILSINKYQVRLGNETVTLGPDESMVYHSTWNTSPPIKAGEDYRGMASVENRTRYSNETYLGGTDLAVTNLSVRSVVWDGDRVWVNATIENRGSVDATDFIVNFTEVYDPEEDTFRRCCGVDNLELLNTTHIKGLDVGNSTNITLVLWNANIREIKCEGKCLWGAWNPCTWDEIADDYKVRVEINTLENKDKEEDDTNHTINSGVHVDKSRDFKITDLSFRVNNESRDPLELAVYDDVTLNVTLDITNLANQGGMVNVSFYIDDACAEHEMGNTTVAFPVGNGTGYAEIEWTVDSFDDVDIIGSHNMIVVADPENWIYEIDGDRNTTYTQPIHVKAPDPEVESLVIRPVNPERNETVSIDVTIANYGDVDAGNVTLTIYDWAERHIEDVSEQSGLDYQIKITRNDAAAMRLYLEVEGGSRVCVNDRSGRAIVCYHENFHGWTPWVLDNSTTIVVMTNGTDVAYAEVSKVYYLASSNISIIDMSMHNLGVNETKKISVNWTPPTVGERLIDAIIDPVDHITEHNKSNNRLTEFIQVQTADLEVSDLSLIWRNGTEIGENDTVKHGDNVTVTTHLANIGVEDTGSFDVRLLAGDLLIKNETIEGLAPDESMNLSVNWGVTVGNHLLKIEADYRNEIDETNETNNIAALKRHVCGANLSGNTSWETLGFHGEILFGPDQPYDEDEVIITATINNSGCVPATDFNIALFYDYTPDLFQKGCNDGTEYPSTGRWINETYPDAEYLYLMVTTPDSLPLGYYDNCRHIIEDDVIIYDGNDSEVARPVAEPYKPCWVRVDGGAVNVGLTPLGSCCGPVFDIYFYPVYQNETSMLFEGIDLPVASSCDRTITRNVSAGDRTVLLIIDPENKVPDTEDCRGDNVVSRIMHVKPARDFTVTNITASWTNLSDIDTPEITANVSNIGLRNGTVDVDFVDYEEEHRKYGYHFDESLDLHYLPIPPNAGLLTGPSGGSNLMVIHRPGVDAIDIHFSQIILSPATTGNPVCGEISVCDANRREVWYKMAGIEHITINNKNVLVMGETAYIYTTTNVWFSLDGYTTETEFHREEVRLNASNTWNESKNITPTWTAYTGDHTITVTLDGDNRITEISESNNKLSSLLHVNASRDPVVVGLNITPEHPEEGEDVDITAVIANNGSKSASFTVDLWANLTRKKPGADESLPEANLTTNMSGDRVRYVTLLKHANLTLAPGENTTVNATWCDISIYGSPEHHIIAIVDPTDEIDETNESNNEIVRQITPNYPDLTIGTAHVRGGTGKAVVPIIEIGGASGASDITVRFESSETEKCSESVHGWDECSISHRGASNMQVLFDPLRADPKNKKGYVVVNDRRSSRNYIKKYRGVEYAEIWGPWVEGDKVWIISGGAGTAYAKITEYRWGNVSDAEQFDLPAGRHKNVEIPWTEYREPYDLTGIVDPDNNITEFNEDNNNVMIRRGTDIAVSRRLTVTPGCPVMGRTCYIQEPIRNIGNLETIEFNVTLYMNATNESNFEHNTTINRTISLALNEEYEFSWEAPEVEPPDDIEYDIRLVADPENVVKELDEDNNEGLTDEPMMVYSHTNYTGGELYQYDTDWVSGTIIYTIGDSTYEGGGWDDYVTHFDDVIPENVKEEDIKLARLYLYWTWGNRNLRRQHYVPVPIEVNMKFNNVLISEDRRYIDYPHATTYDVAWGTYAYDIPLDAVRLNNQVVVDRTPFRDLPPDPRYPDHSIDTFGIYGVGLLVIYEDDDGVLTNYWINEGGDVIYEGTNDLGKADMRTTAIFEGEVEDEDMTNATLWTVTPGGNDENELQFNEMVWENVWGGNIGVDHRCVTEHLITRDNEARLQYISGSSMMSSGAFLFLRYPPDLNVINLTAPESTVVGAHHSINVTIRNDGRSDAHDFNVTFYIDEKQIDLDPLRLSDHLGPFDLPAGENMTLHLYNWTPMQLLHVYNLTAAADVLSGEDWTEIETDNNAMTKRVPIEEGGFGNQTGPRGTGGGSNPTGGEFTEPITGRVMQGIKDFLSGGGGGGAGMFSLTEWIMKGAVWLVLLLFVGLGYWMEQRGYGRMSVPEYAEGL